MKQNIFQKFFTAAADTALGKSKHHFEMAKAHGAMMDEHEKDSPHYAFHKIAKAEHEGQVGQWASLGEMAAACAKDSAALMMSRKAAGMGDDLDDLMPTQISVVAPTVPQNLRAIPRFGAREVGKADVSELFRKMVSVEDGSENEE